MNDLRTAAQQALEAWDTRAGIDTASRAFEALRAALAQQAEPMGAVLVNRESREGVMFYSVDMIPDPATLKDRFELVKVYTAPPKRLPLTEEEIAVLEAKYAPPVHPDFADSDDWVDFARAVERAHGIGDSK